MIFHRLAAANRGTKKVLEQVDHSKVEYLPFRKDFYIEVPEIAKMTEEEVNAYRESLEDIKIRVSSWADPPSKTNQQIILILHIIIYYDLY